MQLTKTYRQTAEIRRLRKALRAVLRMQDGAHLWHTDQVTGKPFGDIVQAALRRRPTAK